MDTLLIALIDIDDSDIRQAAALFALAKVGKGYLQVIDALLVALTNSDVDVRDAAGYALSQLNLEKQDHIVDNLLAVALNSQTDAVEISANSLERLGGNPSSIIDRLCSSSFDTTRAREIAIRVLGCVGKQEPRVMEVLLVILSDSDIAFCIRKSCCECSWATR